MTKTTASEYARARLARIFCQDLYFGVRPSLNVIKVFSSLIKGLNSLEGFLLIG
jgi:hypothetical protein